MKFYFISIFIILSLQKSFATEGIAFAEYQKIFSDAKIGESYDTKSFENLIKLYNLLLDETKSKRESIAIRYALKEMERIESVEDLNGKERLYKRSTRLLYSIKARKAPELSIPSISLFNQWKLEHLNYLPIMPFKKRDKLISSKQIDKEAKNFSKNEIKKLTPNEISNLDIKEGHPWWYSEKQNKNWKDLENWAETLITNKIRSKYGPEASRYELSKYNKVLFLKGVKDSGTSPKAKVVDSLGLKWKLKWGNEVQTEPVANRLYVALGGKYTDLIYANKKGKKGLTLILGDPNKKSNCEKNISSINYLHHCLIKSTYKFDLRPFIYKGGTITEDNIDNVLEHLPLFSKEKFSNEHLIGRQYLTFKESSSELKDKVLMIKIGPVTTNVLGGQDDRVTRGLYLFNLWIHNTDAKEDNNKAILLNDFNKKDTYYIETQHDMGASFGPPTAPGLINSLAVGKKFLKKAKLYNRYVFKQDFIYFPRSWKNARFTDLLWFAKKIVSLKTIDVKKIVDETHWPEHVKKVFVYRLLMRRNRIAEVFGLTALLDRSKLSVPSIKIDLSTIDKQKIVAETFGLDPDNFVKIVSRYNLQSDIIVKNGLITSCKQSLINNLLEKTFHPTGISRRLSRRKDDASLPRCIFKP